MQATYVPEDKTADVVVYEFPDYKIPARLLDSEVVYRTFECISIPACYYNGQYRYTVFRLNGFDLRKLENEFESAEDVELVDTASQCTGLTKQGSTCFNFTKLANKRCIFHQNSEENSNIEPFTTGDGCLYYIIGKVRDPDTGKEVEFKKETEMEITEGKMYKGTKCRVVPVENPVRTTVQGIQFPETPYIFWSPFKQKYIMINATPKEPNEDGTVQLRNN